MRLALGVLSAPQNGALRAALRATWHAECVATSGWYCKFLLRGTSADYGREDDALFFPAVGYNETRVRGPIMLMMAWFRHAVALRADFVGKTDDDVWLNVRLLHINYLPRVSGVSDRALFGTIVFSGATARNRMLGFGYSCDMSERAYRRLSRAGTDVPPFAFASGFLLLASRAIAEELVDGIGPEEYHPRQCCLEDLWIGKRLRGVPNKTLISHGAAVDHWGIVVDDSMLVWHNKLKVVRRQHCVHAYMTRRSSPDTRSLRGGGCRRVRCGVGNRLCRLESARANRTRLQC